MRQILPKVQIGDCVLTEQQAEAVRMAVCHTEADVGTAQMRALLGDMADPLTNRLREVFSIFHMQTMEVDG